MALAAGERLTAGRLHAMTNVAAKLRSDTLQSIPSATVTTIAFDVTEYDTDGMADLPNNQLVIQTAGIYHCTAGVRLNPVDGSRVQISIGVNGVGIAIDDRVASSGAGGYTVSVDTQLAVGDVVTARVYQDGTVVNVDPAFGLPSLSVARVAGGVA